MRDKNELSALKVRLMLPEDAPGAVELYRSVYGEEYPIKTVYDVAEIIRQQAEGDMIRIVGLDDDDQVVAHTAIYRSCVSNPQLYEIGHTFVASGMRNQKMGERLVRYGHDEIYPTFTDQLWAETVCNHLFAQRGCETLGFYSTGIELDLMPAASYTKEQSSKGRVSAVLFNKTFRALPQTVFLPKIYTDRLQYLYAGYDFGHTFLPANTALPDVVTQGHLEVYVDGGISRITIMELGSDLEAFLNAQEKASLAQNACVLQVFLNLASPSSGAAVEILRKHQYFLGGVMPRWFNTDGLLMQKITHEPGFEDIRLSSDRSIQILKMIKDDRDSVIK